MVAAARGILEGSLDDMRETIAATASDALNWRPAGEETNTVAVLAVHSMNSTRWWLSAAMGKEQPERDRPSEFVAKAASVEELLSFFDGMAADCRALLDADAPFEGGALRTRDGETVTAAWALLHALEHLREHVGHVQLTAQLWDRRRG